MIAVKPFGKVFQALFQGGAWLEAHPLFKLGGVRRSGDHVAGLHGQELFAGAAAQGLFKGVDVVQQWHGLAVADVENAIGGLAAGGVRLGGVEPCSGCGWLVQYPDDAFNDVVDVSKVAQHVAVVKDLDGFALHDGSGKKHGRHVWAAPGAIDGKEAQPGGGQTKQVAIGVRHEFVGFLGSCVQADRVVHTMVLAKRRGGVATVNTGAAGIHQVFNPVVSARFQHIHEPQQVGVDVGMRVRQRMSHAWLSCEVDNPMWLDLAE